MKQLTAGELTDRVEIEELFYRYADALDNQDWAILDSIFHEDITTDWLGKNSQSGCKDVKRYIEKAFVRVDASHHLFGNFVVELTGDRAIASVRARCYHSGSVDGVEEVAETLSGYTFTATRTAEGWVVVHLAERMYHFLGSPTMFREA